MYHPNQISSLVKIMVKPTSWRILQNIDKTYILQFTYKSKDANPEYAQIITRRNEIKNYKSLKSIFNDIEKVQQDATIYYHATAGK